MITKYIGYAVRLPRSSGGTSGEIYLCLRLTGDTHEQELARLLWEEGVIRSVANLTRLRQGQIQDAEVLMMPER